MRIKGIILIAIMMFFGLSLTVLAEESDKNKLIEGQVITIISDEVNIVDTSWGEYRIREQHLKIKVLEGKDKGQLIEVTNNIDEQMAYNLVIKKGDKVMLIDMDGEYQIYDLKRQSAVYWLIGVFVLSMLVIGGLKGLKSLISLIITLYAILGVFLPRVLDGGNPLLLASIIAVGVTFISIIIISGINKKSASAIIGTSIGVIFAGLLAHIFGNFAYLTGISTNEAQMLMYIPQGIQFNFRGLLFGGILLGTLGAVMDVSISIASSITEIYEVNPLLSVKKLFMSGMNIGRDVMGTMANTLILAYVGSSLHLMLLLLAYKMPFKEIMNNDLIATEIIRSVAGTTGLIIAIPITAIVTSLLLKRKSTNNKN